MRSSPAQQYQDSIRLPLLRSAEIFQEGRQFDAIAATADKVIDSDRLVDGEYPAYGISGAGAYVTDVDGNRYLDFLCAYGTIILGHAHRTVDDAVIDEIRKGFAVSMHKPLQVALARRIVGLVPGAELSVLLKTGSDATSGALRLARAFTGREVVLRWGYNGWHDWCAVKRRGIPAGVDVHTDTFEYDSLESLESAFSRHPDNVAAIIMMPFVTEPPSRSFLIDARDIAHRHGSLFILDEIRSGFRVALGGAQEALGISADLVTVGKAMANGYAISAVLGRRDVMAGFGDVHISSTYYANSLAMAASMATIDVLEHSGALTTVARLGARLQDGLRDVFAQSGLPAEVVGVAQMPYAWFNGPQAESFKRVFYTETIRRGVFLHPNHHWYISAAMTDADIDFAVSACREAADVAIKVHR